MLWEVELQPKERNSERDRVCAEFDLLTHSQRGRDLIAGCARGFLVEGDLGRQEHQTLLADLLGDPVVERVRFGRLNEVHEPHQEMDRPAHVRGDQRWKLWSNQSGFLLLLDV